MSLIDDVISFTSNIRPSWSLELRNLAVLGQYTTANGPWADDFFAVYVNRSGTWYEAAFSAAHSITVFERILDKVGANREVGLANCTDWAHLVVWPNELIEMPLFKIVDASAPRWKRLLFFWQASGRLELSDEVARYLRRLCR